jgi:hypothetical protein
MEVCFLIFDLCDIEEQRRLRMLCRELNSYFLDRGAYLNTPYANLYYNYLAKKQKYTQIENFISKGLIDCIAKNKQGFMMHICEKDCPCVYDPLFSKSVNRVLVGFEQIKLMLNLCIHKRNAKPGDCM